MTEASVSFAGNLTGDPKLRHTESGIARAMFRVAVSGRREQEASFFTVIACRDQAEPSAGDGTDQGDPQRRAVVSSTSDPTSRTRVACSRSAPSSKATIALVRSFSTNSRPALRPANDTTLTGEPASPSAPQYSHSMAIPALTHRSFWTRLVVFGVSDAPLRLGCTPHDQKHIIGKRTWSGRAGAAAGRKRPERLGQPRGALASKEAVDGNRNPSGIRLYRPGLAGAVLGRGDRLQAAGPTHRLWELGALGARTRHPPGALERRQRRRSRQRGPRLYFQRVPEAKTTKNRVHLDLNASGAHGTPLAEQQRRIDAEVERLLGAERDQAGDAGGGAGGYVVSMADPEGNEFDVQ